MTTAALPACPAHRTMGRDEESAQVCGFVRAGQEVGSGIKKVPPDGEVFRIAQGPPRPEDSL